MIKNFFKKIYINTNKKDYDLNHLGTFSFWRLFIHNLISPGRLINRIKFKQIKKNTKKLINIFNKLEYEENINCTKNQLQIALTQLINEEDVF